MGNGRDCRGGRGLKSAHGHGYGGCCWDEDRGRPRYGRARKPAWCPASGSPSRHPRSRCRVGAPAAIIASRPRPRARPARLTSSECLEIARFLRPSVPPFHVPAALAPLYMAPAYISTAPRCCVDWPVRNIYTFRCRVAVTAPRPRPPVSARVPLCVPPPWLYQPLFSSLVFF